jgi:hypothetical protein
MVLLAQAQQIPARLAQHGRGIVHHPAEFLGQIIEQQDAAIQLSSKDTKACLGASSSISGPGTLITGK